MTDISPQNDWAERWNAGRIGFHQADLNDFLLRYWPILVPNCDARVLVPLCGKSRDMMWLHQRGHVVLGIELVEMACLAFFEEQGLSYERIEQSGYIRFEGRGEVQGITILCADLFSLRPEDIGEVDAWYDRAAIVALPPAQRSTYASWIRTMLRQGSVGLMLTFDYPQQERDGPPFSVRLLDVEQNFETSFEIEQLECADMTPGNRWELSRVQKPVIHLRRR